jgi:hypothetical protein
MIREFARRLTPAERRKLEQQAAGPRQVSVRRTLKRFWNCCVVFMLCLGLSALSVLLPDPARSMYLKGQWIEIDSETSPWPNTDFEIIKTTRDRLPLDIICHGEKLEPLRGIASSDHVNYDWEDHDELFDGELNAYADSLVDELKGNYPLE